MSSSRLTKGQARAIKKAIVGGETVTSVADEYDVPYMTIYRIATGETWTDVKPRGRLIGVRTYSARRALPSDNCEKIALRKLQKGFSNARIANKLHVSESTIQRAVSSGRKSLLKKIERATLAGKRQRILDKLSLTEAQACELES